ncbi:hypothetical protein [Enterobacter asburiae]|uniref:hypothetical protein n=1 Tax=Enterobacter asburiae TaxID=61645 RepID=UPI003C6CAB68
MKTLLTSGCTNQRGAGQGKKISVTAGQLYIAKAGTPHTVETGSFGTLVIIDLPETEVASL